MRRFFACAFFLVAIIAVSSVTGQTKDTTKSPSEKEKPQAGSKVEFPKSIGGKSMDAWIADMKSNPDASIRELAIRTVPLFGPQARKSAYPNLIHALTQERDYSVKMTAIETVPVLGFDDEEAADAVLKILVAKITDPQLHTRYESVMALANCGPIYRPGERKIVVAAINAIAERGLADTTSWQMRRASALALGRLGFDPEAGPVPNAMRALLRATKDQSAQVRREVMQSLLLLGVPAEKDLWVALRRVLNDAKGDRDKSVGIWARVCLMRTEEQKITEKDPNLKDLLANLSPNNDAAIRGESLQAIGAMVSEVAFVIPDVKHVIENDKDLSVVATGVWVLTLFTTHAQEVIPYLKKIEKEYKDESIRRTATEAIKAMTEIKKDPPKKDPKKDVFPKKAVLPKK